jgi:hypothetical protein
MLHVDDRLPQLAWEKGFDDVVIIVDDRLNYT